MLDIFEKNKYGFADLEILEVESLFSCSKTWAVVPKIKPGYGCGIMQKTFKTKKEAEKELKDYLKLCKNQFKNKK